MRWFFGGVIIGLLILELKVLGGCGHLASLSRSGLESSAAGGGAGSHECSCAKGKADPVTQSIAPAQSKPVVRTPTAFRIAGSITPPPPPPPPNSWGINPTFAVF
jgi:hypothetical protein